MELLCTISIPVTAVVIIVMVSKSIASHTFQCKHCSGMFRIKWVKVLTARHMDNEYLLVCPHCSTKNWCTQLPKA